MAGIYLHKAHGWQIRYRVHFPDGTDIYKFKTRKEKCKADDILIGVAVLEKLSQEMALTGEDIAKYANLKYISRIESIKLRNSGTIGREDGIQSKSRCLRQEWSMILRECKKRAESKRIPFDIDSDYLMSLYEQSGGLCEVIGMILSFDNGRPGKWNPYRCSIDRISPSKGYVKGNIRLVCLAVNIAMNTWGLDVLDNIVTYRYNLIKGGSAKIHHEYDRIMAQTTADILSSELPERAFSLSRLSNIRRQKQTGPAFREVKIPSGVKYLYRVRDVVEWCKAENIDFNVTDILFQHHKLQSIPYEYLYINIHRFI